MTLILRGRRFGFSLEEIRQWLRDLRQEGTRAADARTGCELADRQLAALSRPSATQLDEHDRGPASACATRSRGTAD